MNRIIVKYGMIGGALCIVFGLINWYTIARAYGPSISQLVGYAGIVLALMCIPFGIKHFRDKHNQGNLSFVESLKVGTGINLISSFIVLCYSILFFSIEGKEYNQWQTERLTTEELAEFQLKMDSMPEFALSPWFQGIIVFLMVFLFGLIVNLISGLALRRSK